MRRTALIKPNNPHLAGGEKTTIPYEGLMNIRFEESSAYFSFDKKTNQCFQSFKKNISCLRMFGNDVHLFRAAFAICFPVMSCTIAVHLDGFI